jgi:hypothetical protein
MAVPHDSAAVPLEAAAALPAARTALCPALQSDKNKLYQHLYLHIPPA